MKWSGVEWSGVEWSQTNLILRDSERCEHMEFYELLFTVSVWEYVPTDNCRKQRLVK